MRQRAERQWGRLKRSGLLTIFCILAAVAVAGAAWIAHVRGKLHRFTTVEDRSAPVTTEARPGGQPLERLTHMAMSTSMAPEFSQATVAPGAGMLMLQALLQIPGQSDEPILLGTTEQDAAREGAHLRGAEVHVLASSREGSHWTTPQDVVAGRPAQQVQTSVLPSGTRCEATFGDGGAEPNGVAIHTGVAATVSAATTSRGLEVAITARNNSTGERAVTVEWQPSFLAPDSDLSALSYVLPKGTDGLRSANEQPLGSRAVDHVYVLQHSFLSAGPEVLLRNKRRGYALRLTALSPAMRSVRIQAASGGNSVGIAFSTASDEAADKARTVLAPGEKLEWRLRVEPLPETAANSTAP